MNADQTRFKFQFIGRIHSCFKDKFGVPRQPGLAPGARASLEVFEPFNREEAWRGIEEFSHIWLLFVFHAKTHQQWKPTVRPPRLGGNRRIGVFSSRSGFRPNSIGLSAVEMVGLQRTGRRLQIELKGVDLIDGTPVLDVKPYLPYADAIPEAWGGFADQAPEPHNEVRFSASAQAFCEIQKDKGFPRLESLVREVLSCDPRPAYYHRNPPKASFGMRLYNFEIKWQMDANEILVTRIESVRDNDANSPSK
jgi:tRNA-Thr(GGU) m(6)t(6)A37 methyltransferase TsaA